MWVCVWWGWKLFSTTITEYRSPCFPFNKCCHSHWAEIFEMDCELKWLSKKPPFRKTFWTSTWCSLFILSTFKIPNYNDKTIIFLKNSSAKKFEKWNLASYSLKKMWLCTFSKGQMGIHRAQSGTFCRIYWIDPFLFR